MAIIKYLTNDEQSFQIGDFVRVPKSSRYIPTKFGIITKISSREYTVTDLHDGVTYPSSPTIDDLVKACRLQHITRPFVITPGKVANNDN